MLTSQKGTSLNDGMRRKSEMVVETVVSSSGAVSMTGTTYLRIGETPPPAPSPPRWRGGRGWGLLRACQANAFLIRSSASSRRASAMVSEMRKNPSPRSP